MDENIYGLPTSDLRQLLLTEIRSFIDLLDKGSETALIEKKLLIASLSHTLAERERMEKVPD